MQSLEETTSSSAAIDSEPDSEEEDESVKSESDAVKSSESDSEIGTADSDNANISDADKPAAVAAVIAGTSLSEAIDVDAMEHDELDLGTTINTLDTSSSTTAQSTNSFESNTNTNLAVSTLTTINRAGATSPEV